MVESIIFVRRRFRRVDAVRFGHGGDPALVVIRIKIAVEQGAVFVEDVPFHQVSGAVVAVEGHVAGGYFAAGHLVLLVVVEVGLLTLLQVANYEHILLVQKEHQ